jgi:hypothetical protein
MRANIPCHRGRTAEEIVSSPYFDSVGHLFRSVSWLDYFERHPSLSTLTYACIEARQAIEYLFFEELVVSTGFDLSAEEYRRCLGNSTNFKKIIKRLSPNFERLRAFTHIVLELEVDGPKTVHWDHDELMKAWGVVSGVLHWVGATNLSAENPEWLVSAYERSAKVISPLWQQATSARNVILPVDGMHPDVRDIWEEFSLGAIDVEETKLRLIRIRTRRTDA